MVANHPEKKTSGVGSFDVGSQGGYDSIDTDL